MRTRTVALSAFCMLGLTACGTAGGRSAALARPPDPVNVSVYVTDSQISVYPSSVGAGPVVVTVANQGSQSEALDIARADGPRTVASTAPINPQGTTQVTVDMQPGDYTVGISPRGRTEAQRSQAGPIQAASFHIGGPRPGSSNDLMQP